MAKRLSPFFLGPCELYDGYVAKNMENGWQYSKVYYTHLVIDENIPDRIQLTYPPGESYFRWAREGWNNPRAVRYPMGRGAKPEYSYWKGKKLDYISARKEIYAPLYIKSVQKTEGYKLLSTKFLLDINYETLYLRDYDAYRHEDFGMTLTDVLNNSKKKMGHAFVLAMLLTNDDALKQLVF